MSEPLRSIVEFFTCDDDCPRCLGEGTVCEAHPTRPWGPMIGPEPVDGRQVGPMGECWCGAPGMPCRPENRQL